MTPKGAMIWIISAFWSALSALNRHAYAAGLLNVRRLEGVRVISVGNLQAGGAGKTPLVAWIARQAIARGMRICILSRGYRGQWEGQGGVIRPGEATTDPDLCGDEPALLHLLVPEAWIGVGRDRAAQFDRIRSMAGTGLGPELVILDDGLQHVKIARDLDVVALTSAKRSEILHRDWKSAAGSESLVIWTKGAEKPKASVARVRLSLPISPPGTPPLWLVSGTAGPEGVLESVQAAGYQVAKHLAFPDHARYSAKLVEGILAGSRAANAQLALTGKDWVKWKRLGVAAAEVLILEPELELNEGAEICNRLLWGI